MEQPHLDARDFEEAPRCCIPPGRLAACLGPRRSTLPHSQGRHAESEALGIWLVFVPSKITSLVQPLDTHGFAGFKAWLRKQYALLRSKSHEGLVSRLEWLRVLQSAKAQFFRYQAMG